MAYQNIIVETRGSVGLVTLNRPQALNALNEALIEAGATRMRPIFLTAGAALFGSFIITLDPVFSGLAWSFIFGIFASTAFSLYVVPLVYFLINRDKHSPDTAPSS